MQTKTKKKLFIVCFVVILLLLLYSIGLMVFIIIYHKQNKIEQIAIIGLSTTLLSLILTSGLIYLSNKALYSELDFTNKTIYYLLNIMGPLAILWSIIDCILIFFL